MRATLSALRLRSSSICDATTSRPQLISFCGGGKRSCASFATSVRRVVERMSASRCEVSRIWARVTATSTASRTSGCSAPSRWRISPATPRASACSMTPAQLERRVVLVDDEQAVDACAARVEEIACEARHERDVRHERDARETELQLADPLEVGLAVREQVEYREVDGLVLAGGEHVVPGLAGDDRMLAVARRGRRAGDSGRRAGAWRRCPWYGDPSHRQVIVRVATFRSSAREVTALNAQKPSLCDSPGSGHDKLVLALRPGRLKNTWAGIPSSFGRRRGAVRRGHRRDAAGSAARHGRAAWNTIKRA